jgi:hypothetical protein
MKHAIRVLGQSRDNLITGSILGSATEKLLDAVAIRPRFATIFCSAKESRHGSPQTLLIRFERNNHDSASLLVLDTHAADSANGNWRRRIGGGQGAAVSADFAADGLRGAWR